MNTDYYIFGFGLANYRSFGSTPQFLFPMKKINFIIGENNTGKSNLTLFAAQHLFNQTKIKKSDIRNYDPEFAMKRFFAVNIDSIIHLYERNQYSQFINTTLSSILTFPEFNKHQLEFWPYQIDIPKEKEFLDSKRISPSTIEEFCKAIGIKPDAEELSNLAKINRYLAGFGSEGRQSIETILIPANRSIHSKLHDTIIGGTCFSDNTIVELIRSLYEPEACDTRSRNQFLEIQTFMQNVLEDKNIQLKIGSSGNKIQLITSNSIPCDFEQIGTGIHQILIMAIATTLYKNHLICIDEPEIHMHPRLQRKLMQQLDKNIDCQFLISTHSSSIIDSVDDPSIFKISKSKDTNESTITFIDTLGERAKLCEELGYKASDIVQTNCIIWVEGPSDRIYIKHWLSAKCPELIEGIHYSIMFYGGKLLSHLSGEMNEIEESNKLIQLLRINKNSFILMDSDKKNETDLINPTKQRIEQEMQGNCWITEGREIENYINIDTLASVLKNDFSSEQRIYKGVFQNRLKKKGTAQFDKVAVASAVVACEKNHPDFSQLNLDLKVKELISFIEKANK